MRHDLSIGIIILCILICGCTGNSQNASTGRLSSDRYIAVLENYDNRSVLIGNTTYPQVQPMPIPTPVPVFDFDNSRGMMSHDLQYFGVVINGSFKALLGKISYLETPTAVGYLGTALTGKTTSPYSVTGIYGLPSSIENRFSISDITQDGTLIGTCDNQTISLKPGEHYTFLLYRENGTGMYIANVSNESTYSVRDLPQMPWPVTNEISVTITNEGIFDKSVLMR